MQLKKKFIVSIVIFSCLFSAIAIIYYKKVQADKLSNAFGNAVQHGKYDEARKDYNKANEDKIINLFFNQNKNFNKTISEEFTAVKDNYIAGKVSFNQVTDEIKKIATFNYISDKIIDKDLEKIKNIENVRQAYKKGEELYNEKKYDEALKSLSNMADIDKITTEKTATLKSKIMDSYLGEVNSQVDSLIKEEKFSDALELLDVKKNIYSENDLNSKVKYINDLIEKKAEEERKRKEEEERKRQEEQRRMEEEEKKRQEAYIASLLNGYVSNPAKENAVKAVASSTRFLLWVNLAEQTTNIFIGQSGDWKLIRSYQCASGKAGDETPKGTFTVTGRGNWFYNYSYGEGAKYWTQFYGNYLFHSFPMDVNGNILDSSLGKPASHGCIRLDISNAKWIYDNIPDGTKVMIN